MARWDLAASQAPELALNLSDSGNGSLDKAQAVQGSEHSAPPPPPPITKNAKSKAKGERKSHQSATSAVSLSGSGKGGKDVQDVQKTKVILTSPPLQTTKSAKADKAKTKRKGKSSSGVHDQVHLRDPLRFIEFVHSSEQIAELVSGLRLSPPTTTNAEPPKAKANTKSTPGVNAPEPQDKSKYHYSQHTHHLPALKRFFDQYKRFGFTYDPKAHPSDEFDRLVSFMNWDPDDRDYEPYAKARRSFNVAISTEFTLLFGWDVDSFECWRRLCIALDVDPIPGDIIGCQERVMKTHVNLVDLVGSYATNEPARQFATEVELSKYTRQTDRIFRQSDAKTSLLSFLLRRIFNPRPGY